MRTDHGFDPGLGQYSFPGLMIVIGTWFIPLSPLSIVSTMVMWESSQWLGKNIVWSTGKKNSRKARIGALVATIKLKCSWKRHLINTIQAINQSGGLILSAPNIYLPYRRDCTSGYIDQGSDCSFWSWSRRPWLPLFWPIAPKGFCL